MTYLVTGGTGFIGAYVVRDLVKAGERVVCFDLSPNAAFLEEIVSPAAVKPVMLVRGDVTDWAQLLHVIKEHGVSHVIHLASLLMTAAEAHFPLSLKVNCQGTSNVFEAAALSGIEKVLWASSVAVFGPRSPGPDGVIKNDSPHDPQTVYGACKSFNEQMALHYARKYDLNIIGLRFSAVYGYGKDLTTSRGSGLPYLDQLIDKPALGEGPCVVPNGDSVMDWLYIEDAARAISLAANAGKTRSNAFIVHGDPRPTREVFDYIRSLLPDADMTLQPGGTGRGPIYDASATLEEIGYAPQYRVEDGMRLNINVIRDKGGLKPVG